MSSNHRQFFTSDDLAMLDRVLAHAGFPHSPDTLQRDLRIDVTRILISSFQHDVTTELSLHEVLAELLAVEEIPVAEAGYDIAAKIFSERFRPESAPADCGAEDPYGKRVEIDGSWTVYHVFTGVPAQFGSWEMTDLDAKTARQALRILNAPEQDR